MEQDTAQAKRFSKDRGKGDEPPPKRLKVCQSSSEEVHEQEHNPLLLIDTLTLILEECDARSLVATYSVCRLMKEAIESSLSLRNRWLNARQQFCVHGNMQRSGDSTLPSPPSRVPKLVSKVSVSPDAALKELIFLPTERVLLVVRETKKLHWHMKDRVMCYSSKVFNNESKTITLTEGDEGLLWQISLPNSPTIEEYVFNQSSFSPHVMTWGRYLLLSYWIGKQNTLMIAAYNLEDGSQVGYYQTMLEKKLYRQSPSLAVLNGNILFVASTGALTALRFPSFEIVNSWIPPKGDENNEEEEEEHYRERNGKMSAELGSIAVTKKNDYIVWGWNWRLHVLAVATGEIISHEVDVAPHDEDDEFFTYNELDKTTKEGREEVKECFKNMEIKFCIAGEDKIVIAGDSGSKDLIVSFLYVIDLFSGQMLWKRKHENYAVCRFMSQPVVLDNVLYYAAADHIGVIGAVDLLSLKSTATTDKETETELAHFDCSERNRGYDGVGKLFVSPDGKYLLVGISAQGGPTLHCIDVQQRQTIWCHELASSGSHEDDYLEGMASDKAWMLDMPDHIHSVHDGRLYLQAYQSDDPPHGPPYDNTTSFIAVYSL